MVDRINDIMWQARQGSVAAIIQVLNEQLADAGVRTRAVLADGILQLLCEARTTDSLEQSTLSRQIREILQSISPRNIYRVNINSRIVREQQLLWLEEINRDTENQLLWSEEIFLEKPNMIQWLVQDFQQRKMEFDQHHNFSTTNSSRPIVHVKKNPRNSSLLGWSIILMTVCSFFTISGLIAYLFLGNKIKIAIQPDNSPITSGDRNSISKPLDQSSPATPAITTTTTKASTDDGSDNFANAVRIANQLSQQGKNATNKTQWLEIAANWQRASDLMAQVSPSHNRYQEAKIRTQLYREYSREARNKADSLK